MCQLYIPPPDLAIMPLHCTAERLTLCKWSVGNMFGFSSHLCHGKPYWCWCGRIAFSQSHMQHWQCMYSATAAVNACIQCALYTWGTQIKSPCEFLNKKKKMTETILVLIMGSAQCSPPRLDRSGQFLNYLCVFI